MFNLDPYILVGYLGQLLKGMARYASQLLAPEKGFGLQARLFLKNFFNTLFWKIIGQIWFSVVSWANFISILNKLKKKTKKKSEKFRKKINN